MTTHVKATVIPPPVPPPPPPDLVELTMPRDIAEAIRSLMNYSPICQAFNELVQPGKHYGKRFQWDGTPAFQVFEALKAAGVSEKTMAYRTLEKINAEIR